MKTLSPEPVRLAQFAPAIEFVLDNEGGYNPNDNGSPSNFGIRQADHPGLDVKDMTRDQAIAIYERDYWKFGGFSSQRMATKLLDMYVNLPPATAIRLLQQALAWLQAGPIVADGILGPQTIDHANAADESQLVDELKFRLAKHYNENADPSEKDGLIRRAVKG